MKKGKKILFTTLFLAILVAISIVCFIVGRGHTLYFDNVTTADEKHPAYVEVKVYYNGEKVTTMAQRERASISFTGQTVEVTFKYTKKNGGSEEELTRTFEVPYSMDKILINLPALFEGEDESVYMTEFVGLTAAETADEEVTVDDGTEVTAE